MKHRVVWLETGQSFEVAAGEAVLEAALRNQIALPHECQFGGCGSCRIKLVEGSVGYEEEELPMGLTPEEAEAGYALACQARPASDLLISVEQTAACSAPTRVTATVQEVCAIGKDVTRLRLRAGAVAARCRLDRVPRLRSTGGTCRHCRLVGSKRY